MPYDEKRGASGQLANSLATIYTVPALTTALLTTLWVYNTSNSTTQSITVAINDGVSRTIATIELEPLEYGELELRGMVLNAADLLQAFTTTATTVNYVLSLVEKT
jgi:hypothetical protein